LLVFPLLSFLCIFTLAKDWKVVLLTPWNKCPPQSFDYSLALHLGWGVDQTYSLWSSILIPKFKNHRFDWVRLLALHILLLKTEQRMRTRRDKRKEREREKESNSLLLK
jgi:hypothetical protein